MVIIIKEVATAILTDNYAQLVKTGIIKNPPPTPIIPVINPTSKPTIISCIRLNVKSTLVGSSDLFLIIE